MKYFNIVKYCSAWWMVRGAPRLLSFNKLHSLTVKGKDVLSLTTPFQPGLCLAPWHYWTF